MDRFTEDGQIADSVPKWTVVEVDSRAKMKDRSKTGQFWAKADGSIKSNPNRIRNESVQVNTFGPISLNLSTAHYFVSGWPTFADRPVQLMDLTLSAKSPWTQKGRGISLSRVDLWTEDLFWANFKCSNESEENYFHNINYYKTISCWILSGLFSSFIDFSHAHWWIAGRMTLGPSPVISYVI